MKITIEDKRRAAPVEAVLCAVGLAETDERGRVEAQFYPVDLILALRDSDKMLQGHPFLDLAPEGSDDRPTVMEVVLRPRQVEMLMRQGEAGYMMAVAIVAGRPNRRTGRRPERILFHYVRPADYLTEEEIHWVLMTCEGGVLYHEQALAVQAMGEFAKGLRRAAERAAERAAALAKPVKRMKRKRVKRKERRRREVALG